MIYNGKGVSKIVVLGLGKSGRAALELACSRGIYAVGIDESSECDIPDYAFRSEPAPEIYTGFRDDSLPDADLIIISPGISDNSHLGALALASGVPVISELEFASSFTDIPILAITGTNGKTTAVEMTAMLIEGSVAAGNIGYPLSQAVKELEPEAFIVECSSFQLEKTASFSPCAAGILNIASDHMNRYAEFADYVSAKFNIFSNMKSSGRVIINAALSDEWNKRKDEFSSNPAVPLTFSANYADSDIFADGDIIDFSAIGLGNVNFADFAIQGRHNMENLMLAVSLAASLVPVEILKERIAYLAENFLPSPHRQEFIAEKDGVIFINDSKSTNPDALCSALKSFGKERNICLIAGGLDKKMDFTEINEYTASVKKAFLIGETRDMLREVWKEHFECEIFDDLENATAAAMNSASKGDVVLLSPACASMDMFTDYKERGDIFRKIILQSLD